MSQKLLQFVEHFLQGKTSVETFVDKYIDEWRRERDNGELLKDDPKTSGKLSTFFCLADLYNPDDDREEYELDENRLREQMQKIYEAESVDDVIDIVPPEN